MNRWMAKPCSDEVDKSEENGHITRYAGDSGSFNWFPWADSFDSPDKSNESSHMSAKQTKCWMSHDVKKLELFGDKRQRQM